jgi:hypothetical protein
MLAVGFVPDRDHLRALLGGQNEGLKLCLGLMRKTITDSKRKFLQS